MARAATIPIVGLEDTVETVNMILYGDPGVGKTVQAGTLPNALFLSTDVSGTVSAKRRGSKAKLWPIETWEDLETAYEWLKDNADDHPYDWVIIDTGTKMQELCLRDILDAAVEENPDRDPDLPSLQNHQQYQNRYKRFFDYFVALPYNVLFVFHVMTKEDEEGDDQKLPQLVGGKTWVNIARALPAKVSVMGFMEEKHVPVKGEDGKTKETKTVRRIHWVNGPTWMAKDRYDCLPKFTDDIELHRIYNRIVDEGTKPKEESEPEAAAPRRATKAAPRKVAAKRAVKAVKDEDEDDD